MSTSWLTCAESEADIATIREITGAAFSTPEEVEILDALRSDPAWIEGLSVVSIDASDVVVGHALLTRCHIDEAPALMLGPVAVRPDRQREGAGSAAILAGLEHARRMGENHVVVVGDPKYYSRLGFTRASDFGM